ncbi:MAG TPA: TonB-dependent receptor [Allosphingosinicella sp.]|jgi:outer membrane receptor protein involved in Fe transport|nr:TonB-dependent receptor [Allosphingosinicella sp.]
MTRIRFLGATALSSAAFIGFAFIAAAPANAQAGQPTQNSQKQAQPGSQPGDTPQTNQINPQSEVETQTGQTPEAGNEQAITVTGSRIRRPNLQSPVPITSVTAEELPEQGQASIGDALNDLPSLRSTFSQQNSGAFIGTAGLNELDLRGLGTSRTLVLVNGRRHVTQVVGQFIVDTNTIPQDLIERIDIVTGGEAAVYGSDAVAGVVNFILKRDFDGARVRVQDGISSRGDRNIQVATFTAGRNFAEGRGNIAVSFEYTKADPLFTKDRDDWTGAYSGRCQFQLVQNTAGEPQAGDGIPDRRFLCGIKNATLSNGGTIGQVSATDFLRFDKGGTLVIDHPTQSFEPFSGNQQGGIGSTLRDTGQLAVGQKRYVGNILAHFDVSQALQFFVEAKFVRQEVIQEGQPSFFQGQLNTFFGGNFAKGKNVPNLKCDNGFLRTDDIQVLKSFGLCLTSAGAFNPAGNIPFSRFNVDWGGRREDDLRQTYRIVGGIQGDFNNNWHYEVSLNYGHFQSTFKEENNLFFADQNGAPAGFALAVDAVKNAAGQVVCRVNQVTVTNPNCVPINLFGEGSPSQAAIAFSNTTSFLWSRASELDALAFISGDSQQLFSLPGGPIGFSIGAEYRRETATRHADPLSASGATFFNAFLDFRPPAFEVKELFGELNVPILKDLPFVKELSLSGAARYSDYNTSAGHTWAWNINGIYSPVSDIRFRANYSKSVRVPTLLDLYAPASQNFAFIADPCDAQNINAGPNRKANCAALGVPTTILAGSPCVTAGTPAGSPFINCLARAATLGFLSSGNPHLTAETGKSLTIGAVVTPRFLPGFSLSVDYFDIKVTNLIATLTAQTIINQCFDLPNVNNQYCQLIFKRDQFGLFGNPAVISGGINFAKQISRGIDFDASYRHNFANGLRLNVRGVATYTIDRQNFTSPTNAAFATDQLNSLGDPVLSANLLMSVGQGPWDLSWTVRYIGRQIVQGADYNTFFTFQGRAPTNPDFADRTWYPDVFYHDVRLSLKVNNRYRFYLGVDNLFDRKPPLDLLGNEGGDPFSSVGRYFYGGAQVDF